MDQVSDPCCVSGKGKNSATFGNHLMPTIMSKCPPPNAHNWACLFETQCHYWLYSSLLDTWSPGLIHSWSPWLPKTAHRTGHKLSISPVVVGHTHTTKTLRIHGKEVFPYLQLGPIFRTPRFLNFHHPWLIHSVSKYCLSQDICLLPRTIYNNAMINKMWCLLAQIYNQKEKAVD